jgi:threonyl-tRNA synthetase
LDKIKVSLGPEKEKEVEKGISIEETLQKFDPVLAQNALAAQIDGKEVDLAAKIAQDSQLGILTFESIQGKRIYWHSTAHILAQAVKELFPDVKLGIGPSIDEGFYYDFEKEAPFTPDDLAKIEQKMREIVKKDYPFRRKEFSKAEAIALFQNEKEKYKVELVSELEDELVSCYQNNDFTDLCRGPHVPSTGRIKVFKLTGVAGAYWRGSEKNPMLQRIYGISFPTEKELDEYLERLEEIKKRDHRKLARELELIAFYDEVGPGLPFWLPKGALIRKVIEDFWVEEHYREGYQLVYTPHIAKYDLWEKSGHTDFYTEYMYPSMRSEDEEYQLRPMNCPFHMLIYNSKTRSYRDLPYKLAEIGADYRYERSGVLHGLSRVRGFTMDDAHIFCRPDQLEDEVIALLSFTLRLLKAFGFDQYEIYLSTQPEKFIGEPVDWDRATEALKRALEKHRMSYRVDSGGGAFYGPKIDLKIKDLVGRAWQCTTIQFDFNLPTRFDLNFVAQDGKLNRPIIIHRALLGSFERFFGILIEHYGGAFPLWLSPIQVMIMPITDQQKEYARRIKTKMEQQGLRVDLDDRNEKINYKIREAETQKIPYMLIVGKKEEKDKTVSVRKHKEGDLGSFEIETITKKLKEQIQTRT